MISFVRGDIWTSPARVLVNTVNTVGVMGRGIALTFKQIYPDMFKQYQQMCERKELRIGTLWLYRTPHKGILNFPTKEDWRQPSKAEYIEAGLKKFVSVYSTLGITSIAFPKLGCGNGGLDWERIVKPMMLHHLKDLPIDIFLYETDFAKQPLEHNDVKLMSVWLHSEPRALAFSEVWNDLTTLIRDGMKLKTWNGAEEFQVNIVAGPEQGLQFQLAQEGFWSRIAAVIAQYVRERWRIKILGPGVVFVPQEALLELWQTIRAFGFCIPKVMPGGLDALSEPIMSLMSRLNYLKPVQITTSDNCPANGNGELGLQLIAYPAFDLSRTAKESHSVQQV